jgi:LysR family glycine cleavage system transcriptional activator
MSYRLPPLTTLRLFEAAARHMSFKLAAAELCLTPSAVSHGIQTLEDWLGGRLFVRLNRGLRLTEAGAAYLVPVQEALSALARATEALPGRSPRNRLAVSIAPTVASRWLLPALPRFQALRPDIRVVIDTRFRRVDFPRDGVDIAIRLGQEPGEGLYTLKLVDEELIPVCTPALAAGISSLTDLARATLLHVDTISSDWGYWFEAHGKGSVTPRQSLSFDTIHMAFDAAVNGLGVAIGRLPMVRPELEAGKLVPVLGPPVASKTAYWLVTSHDALARPDVRAFRDWVLDELSSP